MESPNYKSNKTEMVCMFFSGIKEFWRETRNRKLVTVARAVECTQQDELF